MGSCDDAAISVLGEEGVADIVTLPQCSWYAKSPGPWD